MAEKLAALGIDSVQDLLFHLPLRYQDRTRITPIGALQPGVDAVIEGEIKAADISFGKRRSLVCRIQDGTGTVTLRFYHFNATQQQNLAAGTRLRCYGEPRRGASGLEFYHPEYQAIAEQAPAMAESLTAIYPSTEGLSQQSWRKLTDQALTMLKPQTLVDWLPPELELAGEALTLEQAIHYLHRPPTDANTQQLVEGAHRYQQRLAFEELLAHHLSVQQLRLQTRCQPAPPMDDDGELATRFRQQLGFQLTNAQQRVSEEIADDLKQPKPMLRLVQGDVGSGKTVVAALAALKAVACGYQVAIMAPTEVLAEQHFNNFCQWFEPLGLNLAWLSGKIKGKRRQQQLDAIQSHEAMVIIGTHALFQDDVSYAKLGLVIIDEQHRFGVHQRLALKNKGRREIGHPHQLVMTATPIPRTLAMTAYADLDCSQIDELPPGRTPVNTVAIDSTKRSRVVERIQAACSEGQQAYWVCTLIEESEALSAEAAEVTCENLRNSLPDLKIGLVHGRLKAAEKTEIMQAFKQHQLDLLVATTVIEVGVDVPNASLMIIENAERLGLSQLHQLRGRVGRGSAVSHCVLMYQNPLGKQSKRRLQIMRDSNDGFVIAEKDLEMRGPGELLGTRQTGLMLLKIADLERDHHLLEKVKSAATLLLQQYPSHVEPLVKRWLLHGDQYAHV